MFIETYPTLARIGTELFLVTLNGKIYCSKRLARKSNNLRTCYIEERPIGEVKKAAHKLASSSLLLTPAPDTLDGATVLAYTAIDNRHRATGNCKQVVDGSVVAPVKTLAICKYDHDIGIYLFGCDQNWNVVTDTVHASVDEARAQAEFEYEGVNATWQRVSVW